MAALCPGVKYGLQSRENCSGNKDLIFVKLTDSAFRAIEDYIKNQSKFGSSENPTIKFLGNEGQLSFPTFHNGHMSFNFSMSNTADMEGPGGSFECIQQFASPRGSLEALGVVPHKIRIHANDDVYEATRHRMTVAEENHKNKCTREIKPNQNDIGRKVKVKQNSGRAPSSVTLPRTPPQRDTSLKSYNSPVNSKPPANTNNGLVNGFNHNNSRLQNKPSIPDIARRPIKERLIHLLALRPFKKPELYERLTREGIRERNGLTSVLKQISFLKDNVYHLNRVMWNDVREDWPFYTESEKQILKRRKPQNLTPPGSSDGGSSGSGHSPSSTHLGSPPISTKRPGYYDGADGLPTKRPRISHFRKPSDQLYGSPVQNMNQRRPVTDSRDTSNMNPRSREYFSPISNDYNGNSNEKHSLSDGEDNSNRKHSCDSRSLSFSVNLEKPFNDNYLSPGKEESLGKDDIQNTFKKMNGVLSNNRSKPFENGKLLQSDTINNSRTVQNGVLHNGRIVNQESPKQNCINIGLTKTHSDSPTSPNEQISTTESDSTKILNAVDPEFPNYLTEYTTIKDAEQRKKYKADFNAHYAEYKDLHAVVEKVSCRFAELEERLRQEDNTSPKYRVSCIRDLKKQIVREYQQNKKDLAHQAAKCRFQYLHDKLSHIKRLVLEYDQGITIRKY